MSLNKLLSMKQVVITILLLLSSILSKGQIYTYTNATNGAPSFVAANMTGSNLTRINGATVPGTPCGSGFSSTSFSLVAVSYSPTLQGVKIVLTPNAGYQLSITGFNVGIRRSPTGPATVMLAYQDGAGAIVPKGTTDAPNNSGCGNMVTATYNFSLTTSNAVTLYIFGWGATNVLGTFQIMNWNVNGTVPLGTATIPTITTQPTNATVCINTDAIFTSAANGNSAPTYQWQRSTTGIGGTYSNITSAIMDAGCTYANYTTNTLTVTPASTSVSGYAYRMVATNSAGSATSNGALLTVNGLPNVLPITGIPSMCQGASTQLNDGTLLGTWSSNNIPVASVNSSGLVSSGIMSGTATISYSVTNTCGTTTSTVDVTVNPNITPSVVVNGTSTVCLGNPFTYVAYASMPGSNYQWVVNGSYIGINDDSLTYIPANNDQIKCNIIVPAVGCLTTTNATSNTISITGLPSVTPAIIIQSVTGTDSVCDGPAVIYLSNSNVVGGSYQWKVNGVNVGYNSPAYNYTPYDNDQISCLVTTPPMGCYVGNSGMSNLRTIRVVPSMTPTVTVTGNNPVCNNTPVTYAAITNIVGGSYEWKVNNDIVGTNSNTYTYTPAASDHIICTVMEPIYPATGPCYNASGAVSAPLVVNLSEPMEPYADIHAPAYAAIGSTVAVNANIFNAGTSYSIQWKNNGTVIGTTSVPSISYVKTNSKDSITAIVSPQAPGCYSPSSSNAAMVYVGTGIDNLNTNNRVHLFPNPAGETITIIGLQVNEKIYAYDMIGRKMNVEWQVETQANEQSFNVTTLSSGNYILQIVDNEGNTRQTLLLNKK